MRVLASRFWKVTLVTITLVALLGAGRVRRDPLTAAETDQLREAAIEPAKRLKLYIKFAGARMMAIDQLRTDPKLTSDRGQRIHDLLEDFGNIVDEIDDNVDTYNEHNEELRKPLKELIEADTNWQMKLRTLKDAAVKPATESEARDYSITLDMALDSVNDGVENARKTLQEQVAAKAEKKKK